MWFKNLVVFRFEEVPEFDLAELEQSLQSQSFKPCGSQEMESLGWVAPMGEGYDQLVHAGSGMVLLAARREQRLLPAGVVREASENKIREIEAAEDRKLGRKQKMEIREQLTFEMMPRAFTRSSVIQGLILPKQQLLVVDAASRNRAEEWVSLLRLSLGSLPVKPWAFASPLAEVFSGWLNGSSLPSAVEPGDECVLESRDQEGAVIRYKRVDLDSHDVKSTVAAGYNVTRLAIDWNQSLSMVLTTDADIKRMRFSDTRTEQVETEEVNDEAAEFDARFALLGLELSQFLPKLWNTLGGIDES